MGVVADDYIVGPGDIINLVLSGEINKRFDIIVDSTGFIHLENFSEPIFVNGKKFIDVKNEIISQISKVYIETEVYISLKELKQISITVSGEVNKPGIIYLPGISSVLDALLKAGGIKKEVFKKRNFNSE